MVLAVSLAFGGADDGVTWASGDGVAWAGGAGDGVLWTGRNGDGVAWAGRNGDGVAWARQDCTIEPSLRGGAELTGKNRIRARRGAAFKLVFKARSKTCPQWKITIKDGRKKLRAVRLKQGKAVYKFPRDMAVGTHAITVKMAGKTRRLSLRIVPGA